MVLRPVGSEAELAAAAAAVNVARRGLDGPARGAAFITSDAARDGIRVATLYDAELVLLDCSEVDPLPVPGRRDAARVSGGCRRS